MTITEKDSLNSIKSWDKMEVEEVPDEYMDMTVFRSLEKNEELAKQLLVWIQEAISSEQLRDLEKPDEVSKQNEAPKKRKSLTTAQKKEICLKKSSSPFLKQKDLAKEYYVKNALQAGHIISDGILSNKALEFAFLCKEDKFKRSNRWVDNLQDLETMRENIHQTLKNYDPKDIIN
ncbi:hypothetical protein C1646_768650 [Rhizophagus diaphanus]|nr:hypothetical protein C1646_768650 [Rhizophagus diaphanus] [Rhizophagus sp. MUCL 43196]